MTLADALVQMAKILGEVVGIYEISEPLAQRALRQSGREQGIILTVKAVGTAIAGMLISVTGILAFAVDMTGLGLGLILVQVWSNRDVGNLPKAAL